MARSPIQATAGDVKSTAAAESLELNDDTLRAKAEEFKSKGNDEYKRRNFKEAMRFYTEGIKVNCKDSKLNAQLYNNRAMVHSCLGNYQDSLTDAKTAVELEPTYMKAIERGASACVELRQYKEAFIWCRKGLTMDNKNEKLLGLVTKSVQELWKKKAHRENVQSQGSRDPYAFCKIGEIYRSRGDYNSAKGWYEASLNIAKETGEKAAEGTACSYLGLAHDYLGNFEEAMSFHKRDLELSKQLGDRTGEVRAHCNLGNVYLHLGNYKEAIYHYERDLEVSEENEDKAGEGRACASLGNAYRGDLKKAVYYYERSLKLREELEDRDGQGRTLGNLACAFRNLGDLEKAIDYHERHLSISKERGNRHEEERACSEIGDTYQCIGNFKTAIDYHKRALAITKEVRDRSREGAAHVDLGIDYLELGYFKEAIRHLQLGLQILKKLGSKPQDGKVYTNLGICYNKLGEFKTAVEYHELSLKIKKDLGDRRGQGRSYNELGSTYLSLGNFEKAVVYYNRWLEIAKELGDKAGEGVAYGNIGIAYEKLGDLQQSVDYQERSLEIRRETGDRFGEGSCYGNLGNVYHIVGDFTKAIECHKLNLKVTQELGRRNDEGSCYGNLGNAYGCLKMFDEAKKCYQLSLNIFEEVGHREGEARTHHHLGSMFEEEGSLSEALKCYKSSVAILNDIRDRLHNKDEWKISLRDMFQTVYSSLWYVLFKQGKVDEALLAADQGRAQALDDLLQSNYEFESRQLEGTTHKTLTCLPSNTVFTAFYKREIFHWVIQEGKDVGCEKRELLGSPTDDAADFLKSLIDDEICTKIGARATVKCEDRSLDKLRIEMQSCNRFVQSKTFSLELQKEALQKVYNVVLDPIQNHLRVHCDELIIVPEGPLLLVPYAALVDSNSNYLVESFRIRLLPSLSSLKLIKDCDDNYHLKRGALLVGDPCVKEVNIDSVKLEQLPHAREEVKMIAQLLKVTPLTGKDATKNEVLQRLSSVALVHIAAHGCATTGEIALAPNPTRTSRVPKTEDFILTMKDVLKVKLKARLVVLSCCYSGRGEIKAEGAVGIARAFLGAGACSVLVSLWAISDEATLVFMNCFYQHLVEGRSASQALREAMNFMRETEKFKEPRYWAPFELIGDDVTLEFGASD